MTKQQRSAINRQNAGKSTGPKTTSGKRRSALNAYRHGASGQLVIMPEADMQSYLAFQQTFYDKFKPVGPLEKQFVQVMADASWNRSAAWLEQIVHQKADLEAYSKANDPEINHALAVAAVVAKITKDLSNLSLYDQRNLRAIRTAHAELKALQRERQAQHDLDLQNAALLLAHHEAECETADREKPNENNNNPAPAPYDPAADGFVFSLAEIRQYSERERRWSKALLMDAA